MRNSRLRLLAATFGAASILNLHALGGILYNPVVTMIGDTTASVSGQSRTTTIRIYNHTTANQASPISFGAYNSSATGVRLTNTINSVTEGLLSNNPGLVDAAEAGTAYAGTAYVFSGGYDAANQTAGVVASSASRVVGYMNVTGSTVSGATIPHSNASAYAGSNIRAATGTDALTNYWSGGDASSTANASWRYFTTSTNVRLDTPNTNVRSVELHGGRLFGSTGAGTNHGIYSFTDAQPTAASVANILVNTNSNGGASDEFVLINDPNNAANTSTTFGYDTAYIADDNTTASFGGIQKWTWNGSAWSFQYSMQNGLGVRGLAGQLDLATGNTVLWTTASDGTKLYQITDTGSGPGTFITLATAPTNNLFRGVALAPIPEPASIALAAIALPLLAARRRRV